MRFMVSIAGRFAEDAAASGEGEVRAVLRDSAYVGFSDQRYACIGDASLGCGPLNAVVERFSLPAVGERVQLDLQAAQRWSAPPLPPHASPDLRPLREAARSRVPGEGLGGLVIDAHNSLSGHALPALEAIEGWLVGNALEAPAEMLVGLGRGLAPAGDGYLGGVLVALNQFEREAQAQPLWRWLKPRLTRTNPISAAHLAAAAAGEGHEVLHACLQALCSPAPDWPKLLDELSRVTSGWDSLAGVATVLKFG